MTGIIDEDDYELVEGAYILSLADGRSPDILTLYENLGYEITPELVEEVLFDEHEPREAKPTTMRFWVKPHEEKTQFARVFNKKILPLGTEAELIVLARKYMNADIHQRTHGLIERRVTVPGYVAMLVRGCQLINCTTQREIENFSLPY